jgi:hypothetical protein
MSDLKPERIFVNRGCRHMSICDSVVEVVPCEHGNIDAHEWIDPGDTHIGDGGKWLDPANYTKRLCQGAALQEDTE